MCRGFDDAGDAGDARDVGCRRHWGCWTIQGASLEMQSGELWTGRSRLTFEWLRVPMCELQPDLLGSLVAVALAEMTVTGLGNASQALFHSFITHGETRPGGWGCGKSVTCALQALGAGLDGWLRARTQGQTFQNGLAGTRGPVGERLAFRPWLCKRLAPASRASLLDERGRCGRRGRRGRHASMCALRQTSRGCSWPSCSAQQMRRGTICRNH